MIVHATLLNKAKVPVDEITLHTLLYHVTSLARVDHRASLTRPRNPQEKPHKPQTHEYALYSVNREWYQDEKGHRYTAEQLTDNTDKATKHIEAYYIRTN